MHKTRSIHPKQERLEGDGETHRRDCECARCEAGFTPTEHDREVASRRVAGKQGRRAADRAWERKKEKTHLRQLELTSYFRQTNAVADVAVQRWRELRAKAMGDRRMDAFLRLRQTGISVERALAEVDRLFPADGRPHADNDNGQSRSEFVPGDTGT